MLELLELNTDQNEGLIVDVLVNLLSFMQV